MRRLKTCAICLGILFAAQGCLAKKPIVVPEPAGGTTAKRVVLTMGSWRTEDVRQMNVIIAAFQEKNPDISIVYDPTPGPQYNDALLAQFKSKSAPDIMYLRSYALSRLLYEQGYLEDLSKLPGLSESFTPAMLAPWSMDSGTTYGIPFIATSHGIYFNQDIFSTLGIKIPRSWEELLSAAKTIQNAGIIPFANASGDTWTIAELVFMNIAPNFLGGRDARMEYLSGSRKFDDPAMVRLFTAVQSMAPYLPQNHTVLLYKDSRELFALGKAAMFFSGSWDIPYFEEQKPGFTWSAFAPPPPSGSKPRITFHLDAGIGLNSASNHKDLALRFLAWVYSPECAKLLGDTLPGFFPMINNPPELDNPHANTFLALNKGRETDIRFVWEKLMEGSPSGYDLVMDGSVAVIKGLQTPEEAAKALAAGLAKWYKPGPAAAGK